MGSGRNPIIDTNDDGDADTICVVSIARRECGVEVALQIVKEFGGTRVYVPKHPAPNHPLAKSVGMDNAVRIAREAGGVHSYVPAVMPLQRDRRQAVVFQLSNEGMTVQAIALAIGCSERAVHRDRAALRRLGFVIGSRAQRDVA